MHSHDLTLGLAFGLGALHALEPGHGKTAMLVYLAGERRSFLHPLVMGLSSAVSHSVSLIAIAAMVHLTHHLLTHDHEHGDTQVTESLRWVSALLVLGVGFWMCYSAWRAKPAKCGCSHHRSADHDCATQKSSRTSYSMSALLGVAFGLLPCPSAMAAYFTSMSSGAPVAAYAVIGLFAAGIAFSLTSVGIAIQTFGGKFAEKQSRLSNRPWPWIRAVLLTGLGFFYLYRTTLA
ncbi:MAG: sulfite exporter TauE/SafE family protein [Planctomycetota bacterium]